MIDTNDFVDGALNAVGLISAEARHATMETMMRQNPQMSSFLDNLGDDARNRLVSMMSEDQAMRHSVIDASEATAAPGSGMDLSAVPVGVANLIIEEAHNDPAFRQNFFGNLNNEEALRATLQNEMAADGAFAQRVTADDQIRQFIFAPQTAGEQPAAADTSADAAAIQPPSDHAPLAADTTPPADADGPMGQAQNMLMGLLGPILSTIMNSEIGQLINGMMEKFLGVSLTSLLGSGEVMVASAGPDADTQPGVDFVAENAPDTTVHELDGTNPEPNSYRAGDPRPDQEPVQSAENNNVQPAIGGPAA